MFWKFLLERFSSFFVLFTFLIIVTEAISIPIVWVFTKALLKQRNWNAVKQRMVWIHSWLTCNCYIHIYVHNCSLG